MRATVRADLSLAVDAEADVVLSVAAARGWAADEKLEVTAGGRTLAPQEFVDAHGGRLHRVSLPPGPAHVSYSAEVAPPAAPAPSDELDTVRYLRPSRYVPSDELATEATALFAGAAPRDLVRRVPEWVADHLTYIPGSSGPTDTALDTLRAEQGVCRDYAHLTIGLLRTSGVPARMVSAFAPGLSPMDFHAVVEAFVEGRWEVVDATRLAPRAHLVRIATGRDGADTAFLTTLSGTVRLETMEISAVAQNALAADDHSSAVLLR